MKSIAALLSKWRLVDGRALDVASWSGGRGDVRVLDKSEPEPAVVHWYAETALGTALIAAAGKRLCYLAFIDGARSSAEAELRRKWPTAVEGRPVSGLDDSFARSIGANDRQAVVPPLLLRGTDFQLNVWRALSNLGSGHLISYGGLAWAVGCPAAFRAVGSAVGANSIAWVIPCHRVVRSDGGVGGYRWGVDRKRKLLGNS